MFYLDKIHMRLSSRTDAGVHALMNTALVDIPPIDCLPTTMKISLNDSDLDERVRFEFVFYINMLFS
jgi:tRNA U38,U39,U40 pseudouridine synthase TruA